MTDREIRAAQILSSHGVGLRRNTVHLFAIWRMTAAPDQAPLAQADAQQAGSSSPVHFLKFLADVPWETEKKLLQTAYDALYSMTGFSFPALLGEPKYCQSESENPKEQRRLKGKLQDPIETLLRRSQVHCEHLHHRL